MNQLLITQDLKVLMKDPQRGIVPSNYITCHSTTWKLLSGIIVAKLSRHMIEYMSRAQKEIGSEHKRNKESATD